MTEEVKIPQPVYKAPMTYEARLQTLSMGNLQGECRRLAKKPKLEGAEALIVLATLLGGSMGGNDPYMLSACSRKNKGFDFLGKGGKK